MLQYSQVTEVMSGRRAASYLFVGNLPWTVANKELYTYFSQFGKISRCNVLFNRTNGMSRGFGFVHFKDQRASEAAVMQSKHHLEGNILTVDANNSSF